jgi:hypothetical protein
LLPSRTAVFRFEVRIKIFIDGLFHCMFSVRLLDNDRVHTLLVGGLRSESDLQQFFSASTATIRTHDFFGCVRALRVDATDIFALSYKARSGVSEGCQREVEGEQQTCATACENGALCHDSWSTVTCECAAGFSGPSCSEGVV